MVYGKTVYGKTVYGKTAKPPGTLPHFHHRLFKRYRASKEVRFFTSRERRMF
jgi:hypothetical protein